jgi:nuclear pore complex protein Nup155
MIYQIANHRNPEDILVTWQSLLDFENSVIVDQGDAATQLPYEHIITVVTELAYRLSLSETMFPPKVVISCLERYSLEYQNGIGPSTWPIDLVIDVGMPHEFILDALSALYQNGEQPFQGANRRIIANHIVYLCKKWYEKERKTTSRSFGHDDVSLLISNTLQQLVQDGLGQPELEEAKGLVARIARDMR